MVAKYTDGSLRVIALLLLLTFAHLNAPHQDCDTDPEKNHTTDQCLVCKSLSHQFLPEIPNQTAPFFILTKYKTTTTESPFRDLSDPADLSRAPPILL